jgi:hypothetical protein
LLPNARELAWQLVAYEHQRAKGRYKRPQTVGVPIGKRQLADDCRGTARQHAVEEHCETAANDAGWHELALHMDFLRA